MASTIAERLWKGLRRPRQGRKVVVMEQASPMPEDTKAQVGSRGEGGGLDNICPLQGVPSSPGWCPGVEKEDSGL